MQDDKQPTPDNKERNREAVANIIRDDLHRIYGGDQAPHAQAEQEVRAAQQPQADQTNVHRQVEQQWQQYHTSWSTYYQQYYERYYLNHLHNAKKQIQQNTPPQNTDVALPNNTQAIGSGSNSEPTSANEEDKAVAELHEQLVGTVKERAQQVKKSRHYVPILTGLVFALVFLFLQYNQFLFATVHAYVSPGSIDPQNIVLDPSNLKVGPDPKLIIPKINVEAPMVYGVDPLNNDLVENKLRDGVVHYPIANAASVPGQNGATTILGHSSMDVFDDGKYKFVFVQLSKLETGDNFYINYQGTRYTYSVTKKEIIDPKDIAKVAPTDPSKPSVILITCDPPGTALRRLLVFADQVSPDPAKAKAADAPKSTVSTQAIRGDAPSFLERIFGLH